MTFTITERGLQIILGVGNVLRRLASKRLGTLPSSIPHVTLHAPWRFLAWLVDRRRDYLSGTQAFIVYTLARDIVEVALEGSDEEPLEALYARLLALDTSEVQESLDEGPRGTISEVNL